MISQMHKISSLQKMKKHSSFSSIPMKKVTVNCFMICFLADKSKEIIEQATFTDEGTFGFAAVVKSGNDDVELITSVGGSKMTTMTKKGNIEENLARMMEIVRSINQE